MLFGEDDLRLGNDYASKLMDCLIRNAASIAVGRIICRLTGETDEAALKRAATPVAVRHDSKRMVFNATAYVEHEEEVPFIHAICMVRKEVFSTIVYDPVFRGDAYREETDFYVRASKQGHPTIFGPDALCIHLPSEVNKLGGQISKGNWTYRYCLSLRTNYVFLKRHYEYLREKQPVQSGFWSLMFTLALGEARKIPSFYLRKYAPGLRATLLRRLRLKDRNAATAKGYSPTLARQLCVTCRLET